KLGRGGSWEPLHISSHRTPVLTAAGHLSFAWSSRPLAARVVPRKSAAADGLGHRTREVGGREHHCAGRDLPGPNLDGVRPGTDGRVLFFERTRLLWVDIEDRQPAVHLVEQWAGRKEVTSFVEISDMRHVCVLQGCTRFLIKLWSIRAQKQQCDGEVIE